MRGKRECWKGMKLLFSISLIFFLSEISFDWSSSSTFISLFIIFDLMSWILRINQIRGTFHRQILRVEDRKTLLDRIRQSCATDREALIANEKSRREQQSLIENMMRKSEMWCVKMRREMAALTAVAETLFTAPDSVTPSPPLPVHVTHEEQCTSLRNQLCAADDVLNSSLKAQVRVRWIVKILPPPL